MSSDEPRRLNLACISSFWRLLAIATAWAIAGARADPAPLHISANGHLLVDAKNQPVFLMADTAWNLALRASRGDAEAYLEKRKTQGFNAVSFVLFAFGESQNLANTLSNHYGDAALHVVEGRPDPTQPVTTPGRNPDDAEEYDYWDHVDYLVALTRTMGLYAILLPTWGNSIAGSYGGVDTRDIVFTAESARRYGWWLARRYGNEPHVIWMLGGDRSAMYRDRDYRPVFRALGGAMAEGAPRQLITYHPRKYAPQSSHWFHDDGWLAFNSIQQSMEQQLRCVGEDWARTPPKPTWVAEGRYEASVRGTEECGEWQVRLQAYQTVFAGAVGHMYGHAKVFRFGLDGNDWKEHLDAPGARSVTHITTLLRQFTPEELLSRLPAPTLTDGEPGATTTDRSDCIVATTLPAGGKALVYSANGRPIRINMERLPGKQVSASWFNPRRGTWHRNGAESKEPIPFATGVVAGAGAPSREFVPPSSGDGEDWVLFVAPGAAFPITKPSPQAGSVGDLIHQAGSTEDEVVRLRLLRQLEQRKDLEPALRDDLARLLPVVEAWAAVGPRVSDRGDTRYLCRFITTAMKPQKEGPVEPPAMSDGSPLRPLWAMYRGRMLIWRVVQFGGLNQPGIRDGYYAEAQELLEEARQAFPENRVIRMYLGKPVPWPKSYEPDAMAPKWANLQREGLEKLADVIHWWIDERQITTGESAGAFGGGWGDDVEMWRWWTPLIVGFDDRAVNAAQERLSNGAFRRPRMAKGYTSQMFDVEHTNEDSTDTVQPMMYLNPDDAVWKQRATRLTDLMRDLWTGRNQRGFLQFKSIYFSVDQVDQTPARAFDTVYHVAAIQPALLYWQRTGDRAIGALVWEWLKVWVDAAARVDNGKPAGILPSAIHWPDGNVGIPGKPWWQPFQPGANDTMYNWPGGESMRLMTATLLLAWYMTGEDQYLDPIRSMAAICLKPRDEAESSAAGSDAWCTAQLGHSGHRSAGWPGLVGSLGDTLAKYRVLSNDSQYDKLLETGATGYVKYRLSGDMASLVNDLLHNAEAFRSNWPAYTSEMRWTDRVMQFTSIYLERATTGAPPPPMPEILYCCATGDPGSPLVFPLNAVRWLTPPREIAALVTQSSRDRFAAEIFHFGQETRPMAAELYLLKPGSYTFTVRQKEGGGVLATRTLKVVGPHTRVEFSLPSRTLCEVLVAADG